MEKFIFKIKQIAIFQLFTIFLRYLLGSAFVWASILKLKGIRFTPFSGENSPINSLPHLLESMYQSGFYWHFIGVGQIVAGFLLMSQIFSTLGAIAYFPIILNIVVLTTYFDSPGILAITSLMFLANIYLLFWDWNKLKFVVLNDPGDYTDQTTQLLGNRIWIYLGILLFIAIVVFRILTTRNVNL
ncbi:MAG TPA: hypothetical protein PKY82_12700 [Pyrinomonadaceae bacterium]|nr:hypothetical protein [Pyrinomonadaceae bacterium]